MSNKHQDRASVLFDEVLDVAPEARMAFLQDRCGQDETLRQTVESMLAEHEESHDFLEPPMPAAAVSLLAQFSDAGMVGRSVGPYRLTEMIASGGMGTVFKAMREDDEDARPIAVKLIRQGMDTHDIVRRFNQERATLAELKHPNIAALIDGNMTESGQPYLVMEFVDGTPIDVHCDKRRLGIRERLTLMRQVCQAVQHAHQNLVVHRDLKPSNILVTEDGTPKLVDFGIAKLLTDDRGATTRPVTATGFRLATPQYASPEFVSGEPVTTSVDVYSLGVVLYELLTGRRPYDVRHKPPQEVMRLVCDVEPDKPSTVIERKLEVADDDGAMQTTPAEKISELRRTSLIELGRLLRGDLDTVVLMAMHKDPRRRYASVEQLAQDLDRYLTGFPVRARKDSFLYRTGKLIRRNRIAAAALLAVTLSLVAGATAATLGLVHAQREAIRARTEATKAQRVSALLRSMLAAGDPEIGNADMRVRDVVDQAAARLDVELADEPEVLADALGTIGETYHSLGLHEQAQPALRRAVELNRSLGDGHRAETAEALIRLGRSLRTSGKPKEARDVIEEAISLQTNLFGPKSVEVAGALNAISGVLLDLSDHTGAVDVLRQALAVYKEAYADDHVDTADTMKKLGVTLAQSGQLEQALPPCREALAMNLRLFDERHPRVSDGERDLATVLHQNGDLRAAEPLYRNSLESNLEVLGPNHPHVSRTKNNLGLLLVATGRKAEGEKMLREALALRRKLFGNDNLSVITTLNNIATLLDASRAEPLLRESIAIGRNLFGPDHENLGRTTQNLATCLRTLGENEAAIPLYHEAIRITRLNFGDDSFRLSYPLLGLGDVLIQLDRAEEAEPLLRKALSIRLNRHPESHELVINAQQILGHCLLRLGKIEQAKTLLTKAAPQVLADENEYDHERRRAAMTLLELYERIGDEENARKYRGYRPLPYPYAGPCLMQNPFLPLTRPPIPLRSDS